MKWCYRHLLFPVKGTSAIEILPTSPLFGFLAAVAQSIFAFTTLWRNCDCAWCKSFPQLSCWAHWCIARSRLRLDLPSGTVTRRAIKPNCRSVVDVAKYKLCLRTVWKQLLWSQAENDYCSSLVVSFVALFFSFHFLFVWIHFTARGCKTRTEPCALLKQAVITFSHFSTFQWAAAAYTYFLFAFWF